jgi:hypothetical protein
MLECPICFSPVRKPVEGVSFCSFDCVRCGRWNCVLISYSVSLLFEREFGDTSPRSLQMRSRFSHILRRQQRQLPVGRWVELPLHDLGSGQLEEPLPLPSETTGQSHNCGGRASTFSRQFNDAGSAGNVSLDSHEYYATAL